MSQLTRWERSESSFPLKSVLHGELWDKNILLRCELVSSELEVAFCDWKSLQVGCPVRDLAFLLLSSTTASVRAKCTSRLIERYFQVYKVTLGLLGVQFEARFPEYGIEELKADYEEALLAAFIQSVTVLTREEKYLEAESTTTRTISTRRRSPSDNSSGSTIMAHVV